MKPRPLLPSYRSIGRGAGRFTAAHLLFAGVLAGAIAVRVIAARGYPAPLWGGDSHGYLDAANKFRPHIGRPSGYSVFLWTLKPFHDFHVVVRVQAALGVAAGIMVYAVVWRAVRRRTRRAWLPGLLAAPASVPVLYDANLIQAEHMLLADSLFTFLLVAAVTVVLWGERTAWWTGALAGLLTSFAALTRLAGLPLLALILLAMLLRWSGWRRAVASVTAALVAFTVPFVTYLNWFENHWGAFAISKADNVWLYGRTVGFADCAKLRPPPELAVMCPRRPPSDPRVAPAFSALWTRDSPFVVIPGGIYGDEGNTKAGEFADLAIKKQFGDYLAIVWRDTLRAFETGREPYPTPWTEENLRFPVGEEWSDEQELLASAYGAHGRVSVVEPHATWIRDYHGRWSTPGPALGGLLVVGLGGVLVRLRPRSRWGGSALLPWSLAAALVVIPAATADFDYRYLPPAVPFACLAAALALVPGAARRRPAAAVTAEREVPADADEPESEPEPGADTESHTESDTESDTEPAGVGPVGGGGPGVDRAPDTTW